MNKYFLLIALVFGVLFAACDKKEEPKPKPSTDEPAWINSLKWDEISDNDFILSEDGQTLVKWLNKKVVNLDMNRNARLKQVKTIGKEPFKGCDNLTAMVLSDEVQTLDRECFEGPDNLERIHLAKVRIIQRQAFKLQENLKELHLPKTLVKLDEYFCSGCENLEVLTIPTHNPEYKVVDNVLFDKDMKTLVCYPPQKRGSSYAIPDGIIRLGFIAFDGCKHLTEITCPESVIEIDANSFETGGNSMHYYEIIRLKAMQVVKLTPYDPEDIDEVIYTENFNIDGRTRILVPSELVEQYKSDKVWGRFANQIEAIQ